MKRTITALAFILALGAFVALWIVFARLQDRQRETEQNLQQAKEQVAQLEAENQRLADLQARTAASSETQLQELLRLRAKVAELQRQNQEAQQRLSQLANPVAPPSSSASAPAPQDPGIPRESWAFVGYQTPQNALQSLMWAMDTGDLKTFWAGLSPRIQEIMDRQYAGKSEAEIAAEMKKQISNLTVLRPDSIRYTSETEATVVISSTEEQKGGVRTKDSALVKFINIGGEWKLNSL